MEAEGVGRADARAFGAATALRSNDAASAAGLAISAGAAELAADESSRLAAGSAAEDAGNFPSSDKTGPAAICQDPISCSTSAHDRPNDSEDSGFPAAGEQGPAEQIEEELMEEERGEDGPEESAGQQLSWAAGAGVTSSPAHIDREKVASALPFIRTGLVFAML